jgi:hypothetical protein
VQGKHRKQGGGGNIAFKRGHLDQLSIRHLSDSLYRTVHPIFSCRVCAHATAIQHGPRCIPRSEQENFYLHLHRARARCSTQPPLRNSHSSPCLRLLECDTQLSRRKEDKLIERTRRTCLLVSSAPAAPARTSAYTVAHAGK